MSFLVMCTAHSWRRTAGAAALGFLLAASGAGSAWAAPVNNPLTAHDKKAKERTLPSYHTWNNDVSAVISEADTYLGKRLRETAPGERPAIVLDIDNTSLETTYSGGKIIPAVQPTLKLAQEANRLGAAIFFVSDRREPKRDKTLTNLTKVGYPIAGLCLRPAKATSTESPAKEAATSQTTEAEPSATKANRPGHKTQCRIDIEESGYTIVANIGNRQTDLDNGHSARVFKLPDYEGLLP